MEDEDEGDEGDVDGTGGLVKGGLEESSEMVGFVMAGLNLSEKKLRHPNPEWVSRTGQSPMPH